MLSDLVLVSDQCIRGLDGNTGEKNEIDPWHVYFVGVHIPDPRSMCSSSGSVVPCLSYKMRRRWYGARRLAFWGASAFRHAPASPLPLEPCSASSNSPSSPTAYEAPLSLELSKMGIEIFFVA